VESGNAPVTVEFDNTSQGPVTSVEWDFGDGARSADANPTHRYRLAGHYTVRLTVSGPGGTDTSVSSDLITVRPGLPTSLEVSPTLSRLPVQKTTQLNVVVRDQFGNIVSSEVTLATTAPGSSIGPSGLFTSGEIVGTFAFSVIASLRSDTLELVHSVSVIIVPGPVRSPSPAITPTLTPPVVADEGPDLQQPPLDEIGPEGWGWNILQVAHNDLGRRGMNSALALTRSGCAYVGSRNGEQGVLVLDIADPAKPTVVKEFGLHEGSTSRELRTVEELDLLIVQHFNFRDGPAGPNILEFFDISNCRDPVRIMEYDLGDAPPHEFFAWRDPDDPDRLLLYVSTLPAGSSRYMTVIDASKVRTTGPVELATFDLRDIGGNPDARLHSMSVSDDGTRVYMADTEVGFYVVDSTALARGRSCDGDHMGANPCLNKLNPDPLSTLDPSPAGTWGGHHSFVPGPAARSGDQAFAITSDEFYFPQSCPWGWARILDITEQPVPGEPPPVEIASLLAPENQQENCIESIQKAVVGGGQFTSHNPTVLKNLVLQSWYAGELRVFDISDLYRPFGVGVFFPEPVNTTFLFTPGGVNTADGVTVWSYPVIMDGLIYVTGINEGLLVLQYTGPGHEEVDGIKGPCEGNSSPVESIGQLTGRCFDE